MPERSEGKVGRTVMAIAVFAMVLIARMVVALIIAAVQRQLRGAKPAVPTFHRQACVIAKWDSIDCRRRSRPAGSPIRVRANGWKVTKPIWRRVCSSHLTARHRATSIAGGGNEH